MKTAPVAFRNALNGVPSMAKDVCLKREEKVSMDDFKPCFVMGQGKKKRAMMVRGKSECAWVRVK